MEKYFSRIFAWLQNHNWALNLIFIALCSYFVAATVNSVLAKVIREVPSIEKMGASARPPARNRGRQQRQGVKIDSIAERNLFGAAREQLEPVAQQQGASSQDSSSVSGRSYKESELQSCTITESLRATLVAESSPEWSIAVLYDTKERETKVFSINEGRNEVASDVTLVDIRDREIVVRRSDRFELCRGEGEEANAPTFATTRTAPSTSESSDGEGIRKVGANEYEVDGSEVDDALNNLSRVATQARIVPSFKNGKPNGFKLFSIKPGSIFSKIGLQNGDVLQRVNGYEMDSPDKALELYTKLKDSSSVTVDLQRRGQSQSFSYDIKR